MAFTKLSVRQTGFETEAAPSPIPDIWCIFRAIRDIRSVFGLRPGHVQTLQAMLSFLKPGQGETVFASNSEICRRIGGIDERTFRRHIDRFVELGLVIRQDSPNRKRYRVTSSDGQSISYGLCLTPLFDRADEFLDLAKEMENARRDRIFLRKQILTRLAVLEECDPENNLLQEMRKALRRKLSVAEYKALLARIDAECQRLSTAVDVAEPMNLSASDGQNVRHHSRSEEVRKDIRTAGEAEIPEATQLVAICDQASSMSVTELRSWREVEDHAQLLAPMMGIHSTVLQKAMKSVGARQVASVIFIMLQISADIRNFAAYFHSITLGRRRHEFNPVRILNRLSRSASVTA